MVSNKEEDNHEKVGRGTHGSEGNTGVFQGASVQCLVSVKNLTLSLPFQT